MRATLVDARLARYAGRFVWLELDFDNPNNQAFLSQHGVTNTPTFFVLDVAGERSTATQLGAMTLRELIGFLDRGERDFLVSTKSPADEARSRGDEFLASASHAEAARSYQEALRLADSKWPERDSTVASLVWALMSSKQWQACAEAAVSEAPRVGRSAVFGRIVVSGLMAVSQGEQAPWAKAAATVLEPLAEEAIALPTTVRDHRFQLYQNLMLLAQARGEKARVERLGDRWLSELDETRPQSDDEQSALDIARVDAASILGDPSRVLPALVLSEQAMPNNYNASLRLAQMEIPAKRYDDAVAACDRGLAHVTGPLGQAWLLQTKADALMRQGQPARARRVLEEALRAARGIGVTQARDNNIQKITNAIKEAQKQESQH